MTHVGNGALTALQLRTQAKEWLGDITRVPQSEKEPSFSKAETTRLSVLPK